MWFRRMARYPGRDAFMVTLDHRGAGRSFCRGGCYGLLPPAEFRRAACDFVFDMRAIGVAQRTANDDRKASP